MSIEKLLTALEGLPNGAALPLPQNHDEVAVIVGLDESVLRNILRRVGGELGHFGLAEWLDESLIRQTEGSDFAVIYVTLLTAECLFTNRN